MLSCATNAGGDSKKRPALVLADLLGDDILLCQITSQSTKDNFAIPLVYADFISGSLPVDSYIRPTRIFTADKNIIIKKVGQIKPLVVTDAVNKIINLIR